MTAPPPSRHQFLGCLTPVPLQAYAEEKNLPGAQFYPRTQIVILILVVMLALTNMTPTTPMCIGRTPTEQQHLVVAVAVAVVVLLMGQTMIRRMKATLKQRKKEKRRTTAPKP